MSYRCMVHENSNRKHSAVLDFSPKISLNELIKLASKKLGIPGKKLYLDDGGVIDSMELIRDGDIVYLSCGEAFGAQGKQDQGSPMFSVAVMGAGSVGKSAITLQYVQNVFVKDYDPTIEDAYRKNAVIDNVPAMLDILDTAGQEDYVALRATWMRNRDGFILVFSVNDRSSFDSLQVFYDQLCVMHETKVPPIVVAGNKVDLPNRVVSHEEGEQLAESFNAVGYIETSAKTGQNVANTFAALVRGIRATLPVNDDQPKAKKPWWKCTLL